jgi:small subunit ribosomal protein S2
MLTEEQIKECGVCFGMKTSQWCPQMREYLLPNQRLYKTEYYHIIDYTIIISQLNKALAKITEVVKKDGLILWVGTKNIVKELIKECAAATHFPYISDRWFGGLLTNFHVLKKRIDLLNSRKENVDKPKANTDEFGNVISSLNKKQQLEFDRANIKLEREFGGIATLDRLPDLVIVADAKMERNCITECNKKGIPVIALLNTNCNPESISIPIPCNCLAIRSLSLVLKTLANQVLELLKEPLLDTDYLFIKDLPVDETKIAVEQESAAKEEAGQTAPVEDEIVLAAQVGGETGETQE